jgi:Trypsin
MARVKSLYLGAALALTVATSFAITRVGASTPAIPKEDPLEVAAVAADTYARAALPQVYGGDGIDERKHTVRVLLTATTPLYENDIAARVLDPSLLVFEQAAYTQAELRAVQQRIQNDWSKLKSQGIDLTSVGQGLGYVAVTVSNSDPAVPRKLVADYGAALHVQTGVAPVTTAGRWDPPPYYGGMELDDIGNTSTAETDQYHDCTNGYIGYRLIDGVPFYQVITAGHCFVEPSMVYHTVVNQSAPIALGQVNMNWYFSGSDADALTADVGSGYSSVTSQIITAVPYTHNVDYLDAAPVYGLGVCKSGITTDQACNFTVNSTGTTVLTREQDGTETTLYNQVTACCDAIDYGDSGGPIYHYYQPQSIAADGVSSSGFQDSNGNWTGEISYSFIQNVRNDLGVVICTSTPTLTGC